MTCYRGDNVVRRKENGTGTYTRMTGHFGDIRCQKEGECHKNTRQNDMSPWRQRR